MKFAILKLFYAFKSQEDLRPRRREWPYTDALCAVGNTIAHSSALPEIAAGALDVLVVLDTEREVREIALKRQQLKREQDFRQVRFTTLDDISKQIKEGKQVDLNVIIKGDVDGSVEALSDSLLKLGSNEVKAAGHLRH